MRGITANLFKGDMKNKGRLRDLFRRCLTCVLDIEVCLIMLSFVYSLFSRRLRPVKKFVIFAQGRTGSTLLIDLLDSHPQIHCDGEILDTRRRFLLRFFLEAKSGRWRRKKTYGFSVRIKHIVDNQKIRDAGSFLADLYRGGWNIIYLKRRNILRQTVSVFVVKYRNKWERFLSDPPERVAIRIDCKEFLRRMKIRERSLKDEEKALAGLPHLALVYEDHLLKSEHHQLTLDGIFEWLGVPSAPVGTNLVKITPEKLSDFIENYDEFIKAVNDAGYARFLDEADVGTDNYGESHPSDAKK